MAFSWIVEDAQQPPQPVAPVPEDDLELPPEALTDEQLDPRGDRANPEFMTDAELLEAIKDPRWRLRNLYYILDKEGHEVKFVPNDVQEKFFDDIWFRNVIPKARQRGFTTAVCVLALDYVVFTANFAGALINQDFPTALRIFREKVKFAYDRLPPIIRQMTTVKTNNKSEFILSNNSSLYCAVTTRGGTLQFLHVSELGQISKKHPEKATEIQLGSLPSVDQTGIIIIESTVESADGLFPDMVRRARKLKQLGKRLSRLEYRMHWASWWDAQEYEADPDGVVITSVDNAYFERLEAEIGTDPAVAKEWAKIGGRLSLRKRAWYVLKRENDFNGDAEKMKSQYPSTLDEAFEVSTDGLWIGRQLAQARVQGRVTRLPFDPSRPVHFFWDIGRSDWNTVWCGQDHDPWMDWIGYYESSNEAFAFLINQIRSEHPDWTWGKTMLPHDGSQRQYGTHVLRTAKDMFEDLMVPHVDIVPRTLDLVEGGIEDLRAAMSLYRFDETGCADGLERLDGYSKKWNTTMGRWTDEVAKNDCQHAADALRQHAQVRHDFNGRLGGRKRSKKSNTSAMSA